MEYTFLPKGFTQFPLINTWIYSNVLTKTGKKIHTNALWFGEILALLLLTTKLHRAHLMLCV